MSRRHVQRVVASPQGCVLAARLVCCVLLAAAIAVHTAAAETTTTAERIPQHDATRQGNRTSCHTATSCSSCASLGAACGWCVTSAQCLPGSHSGPSNGNTCSWWAYATCPACLHYQYVLDCVCSYIEPDFVLLGALLL